MQAILTYSNSLAEFKTAIKDLQLELVKLDSSSEEYKETLKQVQTMQGKLNEVMRQSKQDSDSDANSLNALRAQLSQMKAEAAKLDIGSSAFIEASHNIKELNDRIKQAEESQGNFSRNVGNYAESFKNAFNEIQSTAQNTFKAVLTGQISLQEGFKGLTTVGKGFIKNVLTAISKHPIMAAVGILVGLFIKIKNAIKGNEEAQDKWNKAMAAFQPIINVFNRIIGYLADGLATAALWIAEKIPSALGFLGKAIGVGIKAVKNFLDSWEFLAKGVGYVLDWIVGNYSKFVGTIAKTVAKFTDILGLDSITKKLNSFGDAAKNFTLGAADAVSNVFRGIDEFFNKAIQSVENYGVRAGKAVSNAMKREEDADKLLDKKRENEVVREQSRLKQEQLLTEAYKHQGEERQKYLKDYMDEVDKQGEREKKIAETQFKLAKQLAALAPNSKEENDRLYKLQANVIKVQSDIVASKKRAERMIASINEQEKKSNEALTKSAKKEAEKRTRNEIIEAENAARQKEKIAKDSYEKINKDISNISTTANNNVSIIKANEDLMKQQGLLAAEQATKNENDIYDIKKESLNEQLKLYQDAMNNEELLDEDRLEASRKVQSIAIEIQKTSIEHQTNLEKIKNNELERLRKIDESNAKRAQDERYNKLTNEYAKERQSLLEQYESGKISYSQFEKSLINLQEQYNSDKENLDIQSLEDRVNLAKSEYERISQAYGENSQVALDAYQAIQNALTDVSNAETEKRINNARRENKEDEKTKNNKIKAATSFARSIASLSKTVIDAKQSELQAEIDNGEITQEEAEKEFETLKSMNIATTIISTIAGAIGAYMQDKEAYPSPWNYIIAATDAAATLATGYAEVENIKRQTFNSSSSSSSAGFSGAGATPLLNQNQDINQMTSLNVNGDSTTDKDNRVYILESDIQKSNNRVKTRESETTF